MKEEAYKSTISEIKELENMVGQELGLSEWTIIDQERIDVFAKVTEDEQWIHVDPEMSKAHSPYKKTIAHGFLGLSLLSKFCYETFQIENVVMGVNYGLDKVRFPCPVVVDSEVRGRVSLMEYEAVEKGAKFKVKVVVELKGIEKPACVAEFLSICYHA